MGGGVSGKAAPDVPLEGGAEGEGKVSEKVREGDIMKL